MTVGERMKSKRKELGMSAEQVAEKLMLSPSTIYRYENGDIEKMGIDKLQPIADVLQCTPAYLMGWAEETYSEHCHYTKLADLYHHGVMVWSEDRFLSHDETVAIRMFYSELLLRSKKLVECVAKSKAHPTSFFKAVEMITKESNCDISPKDLIKLYWDKTLQPELEDLSKWISSFTLHLSITMAGEIQGLKESTDEKDRLIQEWEIEEWKNTLLSLLSENENPEEPSPSSAGDVTA